jgi:hypothetical protein
MQLHLGQGSLWRQLSTGGQDGPLPSSLIRGCQWRRRIASQATSHCKLCLRQPLAPTHVISTNRPGARGNRTGSPQRHVNRTGSPRSHGNCTGSRSSAKVTQPSTDSYTKEATEGQLGPQAATPRTIGP